MNQHEQICSHSTDSHAPCVSIVPIFNHLPKEQLLEITKLAKAVSFKRGEMIYRAGDRSDSLCIMHKGKIKIYRLSEAGKEQIVRILEPGEFTGELAVFKEGIHESYAEAMGETRICLIQRNDLQALMMKYPSIALKILSQFSHRLEQSEKQTTWLATEKVDTRLALYLAECLNDASHEHVFKLPMSKKDLASFLGTTPETLSRKLTEFEEHGLIKQKDNKRIEILDLDGLLLV